MSRPHVLFVCTHNSARSQMAEAWLRHLAGDRFEVRSAGVEPGVLHPLTVQVMREAGINMNDHRAKGISEFLGRWNVNYLITVCDRAAQSCPTAWPGLVTRLHWFFTDPSSATGTDEQRLEVFRRVRDEIRRQIETWLSETVDASGAASSGQRA